MENGESFLLFGMQFYSNANIRGVQFIIRLYSVLSTLC